MPSRVAARRLRWGSIRQIDVRAQYAPLHGGAAPPRAGGGAPLRRPPRHRRRGHRRHARGLQHLRRAAAGAVPHARVHADAGAAGGRVGRAHLRDPRHRAPRSSTGPAPSTSSSREARWSCATSRSATARPARCSSTSTCTSRRARRSPSSGARAAASRPIARLLPRFYDVSDGAVLRRRARRARPHRAQPAGGHRPRARRAVPLLGVGAREHRLRAARRHRRRGAGRGAGRGRRGLHRRAARGVRQRGRRARLHALGRPAAAHRHRPHAPRRPRDPHPRRRHQRHRRAGRGGDPRRAARADGGPHDAGHRPPAVHHQPRRAGRAARRAAASSPTAPTPG